MRQVIHAEGTFLTKKKGFLLSEEYDIMVINIFNNILEQFIRYVKEENYLRDPADIFFYWNELYVYGQFFSILYKLHR